ncbi:MAG: hypothetical protein WC030_01950 [Candidatus Paceibacterota bacterium]
MSSRPLENAHTLGPEVLAHLSIAGKELGRPCFTNEDFRVRLTAGDHYRPAALLVQFGVAAQTHPRTRILLHPRLLAAHRSCCVA